MGLTAFSAHSLFFFSSLFVIFCQILAYGRHKSEKKERLSMLFVEKDVPLQK